MPGFLRPAPLSSSPPTWEGLSPRPTHLPGRPLRSFPQAHSPCPFSKPQSIFWGRSPTGHQAARVTRDSLFPSVSPCASRAPPNSLTRQRRHPEFCLSTKM